MKHVLTGITEVVPSEKELKKHFIELDKKNTSYIDKEAAFLYLKGVKQGVTLEKMLGDFGGVVPTPNKN